ncbi:hypothetical protein BAE46_07285 [Glaciecola punicea]|jgi:uncharacterized Zn-finger protein|uniref:hypothetical protein n=1 Tax=Glaciecola punicea TaxID=56804 RepID=UPI00058B7591|nr:hypothetical protein [Glaciecola punicea]OFA32034.1 hypothetical protein BAE46_07285 [Glaciecola punicea]
MNFPGRKVSCSSCDKPFLESRAYKFDIEHPRDSFTCPYCSQEFGATLYGQSMLRFHTVGIAIALLAFAVVWLLVDIIAKTIFDYSSFQTSYLIGMFGAVPAYEIYRRKYSPKLIITPKKGNK